MSGILFLSSSDFKILKGTKGNILCNAITGFSLILFFSLQCQHCQNLIPIFKTLPGTVGGCQFGMLNVTANREVVSMAANTITPIEYVPFIILFINGKPFMKYTGKYDKAEIINFVVDIATKINSKQQFTRADGVKENARGPPIPAYSVGIPLYGDDDDYYLEYNIAYKPTKS
jgi:hypothetical protein